MGEHVVWHEDVPAPPTLLESPLLRAKLRPPQSPPHFVLRQRLHDLLDESVQAPLTLVVAPAGAGKTQLLAGWMNVSTIPSAWLSIDEIDRDPTQLWAGLMAAIDSLAPGCCTESLPMLRRSQPLADVVGQLLNDLHDAEHAPPLAILIVDDVHLIADHEATATLGRFVLHLPSWLHVVLSSRRLPELPVDRLRARGHLAEVWFSELRFSDEESFEMLSRLAPSMPEDAILDTAAGAEGWAVGLQMAALAARANRAQATVGAPTVEGQSLVDDFVWHEVLAAEPEQVVDVLLDVCVTDRVNASLAAALARRDDAGAMLLQAQARGLFIDRLGTSGWFEIHSLVKSSLRAELSRRSPSRLRELHARAARWYQDEGEVPIALEHWLLAENHREALHLLAAKHAELYDAGHEATILRTIAAIPVTIGTADHEASMEFAWVQLLVDRKAFINTVQQAAWWVDHQSAQPVSAGRLTMLQSIVAMAEGDWIGCGALARRALDELQDDWWRDPIGRFGWNMVGRQLAYSESWLDSCDDVLEADMALSHDPERRAAFEGTRALGLALAGRPTEALRTAAGISRVAQVTNMTILRAELQLAEAIAHRELGDRSRAIPELAEIGATPAGPMLMCRVMALLELADDHLDTHDLEAARSVFASAESLVEAEGMRAGLADRLARTGTQLALAGGDLVGAREWADRISDTFWAPVSVSRVELEAGRRSEAVLLLDQAVPRCERHEVVLGLLRACAHEGDEAAKYAETALELAVANEMLQTVASNSAATVDLIERAAWRVPAAWMTRLRRQLAAGGSRPPTHSRELVEQLTDRERDVLRYLPSRLTVREIANELYVSVNTLKFHLKVIYRKLGVTSRAEAAAKARELLMK